MSIGSSSVTSVCGYWIIFCVLDHLMQHQYVDTESSSAISVCGYWIIFFHINMWILNTEPSSITSVCEYWIFFYQISMWTLNLLLQHQYVNTESSSITSAVNAKSSSANYQYVDTGTSSVTSVCEYWNIICNIIL